MVEGVVVVRHSFDPETPAAGDGPGWGGGSMVALRPRGDGEGDARTEERAG